MKYWSGTHNPKPMISLAHLATNTPTQYHFKSSPVLDGRPCASLHNLPICIQFSLFYFSGLPNAITDNSTEVQDANSTCSELHAKVEVRTKRVSAFSKSKAFAGQGLDGLQGKCHNWIQAESWFFLLWGTWTVFYKVHAFWKAESNRRINQKAWKLLLKSCTSLDACFARIVRLISSGKMKQTIFISHLLFTTIRKSAHWARTLDHRSSFYLCAKTLSCSQSSWWSCTLLQ